MPKLMLITPALGHQPLGGRSLLSQLHQDCLREILGGELLIHQLPPALIQGVVSRRKALRGFIDGVTDESEQQVFQKLEQEKIQSVFMNGSNLGELARAIRSNFPLMRIITFFHNIEARFFLGALAKTPTLRSLGVLLANYRAEKSAVENSDKRVALNQRDAFLMERIHGRGATDLLPMAIKDTVIGGNPSKARILPNDYILFVGGAFYANVQGIRWFARHVAPHLRMRTCVVGCGLDDYKAEFEQWGNVDVIGQVEHLAPWYLGAKVAIAPIFDGSGMKTKVAEALMFGTRIVGTAEAFIGYEEVLPDAGWLCNNDKSFIRTLNQIERCFLPHFDQKLRDIYEKQYSQCATIDRLRKIID